MRKILHIDCDCFYAAIEMRDDPRLRGRPLAVGGDPGKRGVIATCNYEARAYGVRSAMASAYAKKLCPELLIVPGRMSVYREVSQAIQAIFADYTPLIQPLSLDEAYLDVTDSPACRGSATLIAREIRQRVRDTQGITVSAGVAPNKFLAKIASDWNKPDGLKVILPDQVEDFLRDLPVSRLHGVGRKTAERLQRLGVDVCSELLPWRKQDLAREFGSFGERLWELARGIDERPVVVQVVCPTMGVLRRLRLMMWLSPRTFRTGFLGRAPSTGTGFLALVPARSSDDQPDPEDPRRDQIAQPLGCVIPR